jgi:hypothetical protein
MIAHCSAIYMTRVAGCGFKLRPRDIYHLERADLAVTLEVEKWEACIFENASRHAPILLNPSEYPDYWGVEGCDDTRASANGFNNLMVPAIPPLLNHHAGLGCAASPRTLFADRA